MELTRGVASYFCAFAVLLVLASAQPCRAQVFQLFPTYAILTETGSLRVPVAGQAVDPTRHSPLRGLVLRSLARKLSVEPGTEAWDVLDAKTSLFLARGLEVEGLEVAAGDVTVHPTSHGAGLFEGELVVPPTLLLDGASSLRLRVSATTPAGGDSRRVPVIGPEGLSVVTDVDDTVKITNCLDEREKLANLFLRPLRPVPGMAEMYRTWAASGDVAFHYVTGEPWPLLAPLEEFLTEQGFPEGSLHLLRYSLRPGFLDPVMGNATRGHKLATIERLMTDFPRRRFFLVGDSAEGDPEVYGELARRHPGQVVGIRIRDVDPRPLDAGRAARAFAGIPTELWVTFTNAAGLDLLPGQR